MSSIYHVVLVTVVDFQFIPHSSVQFGQLRGLSALAELLASYFSQTI